MVLSHEIKFEMRSRRSVIPVLDLLRIEDSALDPFVLLVNNTEPFEHQSQTYKRSSFAITRGPEGTAPGDTTINIVDPDQSILLALKSIPPRKNRDDKTIIRWILVKTNNPDFAELSEAYEYKSFEVGDNGLIVLTVSADPYMTAVIPAHCFTPDLFPCLFPTIEGE